MAHLSYVREVMITPMLSLERARPLNTELGNFAAFCGSSDQRRAIGMQAIAGFCGEVGIVVLHDDDRIEAHLSRLPQVLNNRSLIVRSSRGKVYDPFYGMSANSIADLLVPANAGDHMTGSANRVRSGIFAYLQIMEYQFKMNSRPFGKYPYNLDLLFQMSAMPYDQLYNEVICHLPDNIRNAVKNILDQQNMQRDVHAAVLNMSNSLGEHFWVKRGFGGHTGLSIIDSVKSRHIICVRVPNSLPRLLEYIDTELQILSNERIPMLIVSCGLKLNNCTSLQERFLPEYSVETTYTGILSDSMSALTSDQNEVSHVFSRYPQVFVFKCSSNAQAEPFSAAFGTYQRTEIEYTRTNNREPFKIFATHGHAAAEHIIEERNVRPEDLTSLTNGVMICGSAYDVPQLVNNFDLNGGINHGMLLPGV